MQERGEVVCAEDCGGDGGIDCGVGGETGTGWTEERRVNSG